MSNKSGELNLSKLVHDIISPSPFSISDFAGFLGIEEQSFRNKLSRNSFSVKDIMTLAYVCNVTLRFESSYPNSGVLYISIKDLYPELDETLQSLKAERAKQRYDKLKEELKNMQDRYGFE